MTLDGALRSKSGEKVWEVVGRDIAGLGLDVGVGRDTEGRPCRLDGAERDMAGAEREGDGLENDCGALRGAADRPEDLPMDRPPEEARPLLGAADLEDEPPPRLD